MKKNLTLLQAFCLLAASVLSGQNAWQPVSINQLPANFEFKSISVLNDNVVWAVADSLYDISSVPANAIPVVMRTLDGGQTWEYHQVEEAIGRFAWDIQALNDSTAIFTTNQFNNFDNRPIYKTTNGGVDWRKIVPPQGSGGVYIHFFDAQNGVVINRQRISTTTNAGENWTLVPAANIPTFGANEFTILYTASNATAQVGDHVWFGTSGGRVYHTTDRGHHWTAAQVAASNEVVLSIAFSDTLNGVALVNGTLNVVYPVSKLYKTTDGGLTWTPAPDSPQGDITVLGAVPGAPRHYFSGSLYEIDLNIPSIDYNTDHLETIWTSTLDSSYLNCIEFISPYSGYALGYGGRVSDEVFINGESWLRNYIWKWTANLIDVTEVENAIQLQLMPNPASDWLYLDWKETGNDALVRIFNPQGQLVQTGQVSRQQPLSIRQLPAGPYVLHLETAGQTSSLPFVKL
ncbi:MAG: T9SS type A sorting domain-containing protein [Saprospiraceae bacterium]|nr:T9SS type A sorting domain-containing protein [Saprospiraceae bacterium]